MSGTAMCSWKKEYRISDYLRLDYEKWRDREYIFQKDPDGNWHGVTFGRVIEDVWALSSHLLCLGYQGKHVALYGKNSYQWMVADLSIMGYVGVCFPLNREFCKDDLRRILRVSDVALFLYASEERERLEGLQGEFPQTVFLNMEECLEQARQACQDSESRAEPPSLSRDGQETATVLFTSGTAAEPKAVMLSQNNLFHNWPALYERTPMDETDRILLVLPLSHVYAGVAAFLYTVISGMQIFLGSPVLEACLKDFQTVRPTVFIAVPLLMERFVESAEKSGERLPAFFGSRMKYLYCGGSPMKEGLKRRCEEEGLPLLEAYGLSETSSVVALDVAGDLLEGSVGKVLSGLDVRILHPDPQGIGEIAIRGGSVMQGYFRSEGRNRESFDEEGFFHTGDLGLLLASGHLCITGRKKRMLLTGNGRNVYPDEIEALICENPIIKRALMVQRDDEFHLTVWYQGEKEKAEEWIRDVRERLPGYQRFKAWTALPDEIGKRIK